MSQTQQLYRLQILDSQVDKAKQELAKVNATLGESEALKKAKASVAAASEALRKIQTTQKDLELEVKGLSDKINGQEKLLYGGKPVSAKEAANLQNEITSLKKWHATREELLLETMVEAEEKQETLDRAQGQLDTIEATWRNDQADLIQRQAELQATLAALKEQRLTITNSITASFLAQYEAMRLKKGGVAVAGVKDNTCQACAIMVSNNKVHQARGGDELFYCGTCGRILHVL